MSYVQSSCQLSNESKMVCRIYDLCFYYFADTWTYILQVDIAYIPFVERFQIFLSEVFKYDITAGRPKLANWIEVHSNYISIIFSLNFSNQ